MRGEKKERSKQRRKERKKRKKEKTKKEKGKKKKKKTNERNRPRKGLCSGVFIPNGGGDMRPATLSTIAASSNGRILDIIPNSL
jgi:hypothetical protein